MPASLAITVAIHPEAGKPGVGAGWLLPDGDVLTCQHVVGKAGEVTVRPAGQGNTGVRYRVVAVADVHKDEETGQFSGDLALLRLADEGAKLRPGAEYFAGHAELGDEVDGYGFPRVYPTGQSGSGRVGQVSSAGRREIHEPLIHEHRMFQGFSGCPVISRRSNEVIGLFVSTVDPTARGYLIPIGHLARWLGEVGEAKDRLDIGEALRPDTMALYREVLGNPPQQPFPLRVRSGAPAKGKPESAYIAGSDLSPREFVDDLRKKHRHALLLADGGSGKSTFFIDVVDAIERAEGTCLWLDTKRLGKLLTGGASFNGLAADDDKVVKAMFDGACVHPSGWGSPLENDEKQVFVIADGINEIGEAASDLLARLKRFAHKRGMMTLIVNARTTTRLEGKEDLAIYTMAQLPLTVVETATRTSAADLGDGISELLSKPQMLLMWLKIGEVGVPKPSDIFERYFTRGLEKFLAQPGATVNAGELLDVVAETTYALLRKQSPALTFQRADYQAELNKVLKRDFGPAVGVAAEHLIEKLCGYDFMQASGDDLTYHHQLYAEWLAARHFVGLDAGAWTGGGFGAISIEDSSDDGLKLAVEMVDAERRDELLTRMYDWRWRRVLEFAVEDIDGLTPELRSAVIGLNALRLCDDFQHTRAAVGPYFARLEAAGDAFAGALMSAASGGASAILAVLREAFVGKQVPESLQSWVDLLDATTDTLLSQLVLPPPFVGWSASNLLRVESVGTDEARRLCIAYDASHSTSLSAVSEDGRITLRPGVGLRWRVVHTLGRARQEARTEVLALLLRVWRDQREHRDVRFGACRALMEIAIADEVARETIMAAFKERLVELGQSEPDKRGDRDREFKAMEEFWRASSPACGAFDAAFVRGWKDSLRDAMSEALRTAKARGWPPEEIEAAMAFLEG